MFPRQSGNEPGPEIIGLTKIEMNTQTNSTRRREEFFLDFVLPVTSHCYSGKESCELCNFFLFLNRPPLTVKNRKNHPNKDSQIFSNQLFSLVRRYSSPSSLKPGQGGNGSFMQSISSLAST